MSIYAHMSASPNDFAVHVDKLIKGLDKGKKLIVKDGNLRLEKQNNTFIYGITRIFSSDKTKDIPEHLQKLDEVVNSFFQSKLLDQHLKENLYYKWSMLVGKVNSTKIIFVSSAIKNFGGENSNQLTLRQSIFNFYKDLGGYPYYAFDKRMNNKDWFATFKEKYLTCAKQENFEKKVIQLLMQENELYRKKIPMTRDMLLCRFLLFAFLETCAAKGSIGSDCYLDNTLKGYKNEPLLTPLISDYYLSIDMDGERFSRDLITCAFEVIDDAKGVGFGQDKEWPPLAIDNFIDAVKQVRPLWYRKLESL
jgi:hypothetical protein